MSIDALRSEYRTQTMGPLILERVRSLVDQQLRHRDPKIYAGGVDDYRDGLDDVLSDFTIDVLLGEGQLAYFMTTATSADEFDRLTNFKLKRYLARTRNRSIVDNLIDRSIVALEEDDQFTATGEDNNRRFSRTGVEVGDSAPSDLQIQRAAAVAANAVPRIFTNPNERAPKIYTAASLTTLLRISLTELQYPVDRTALQKLFEILLTPWLTTVLGLDEAVDADQGDLTPEENVVAKQTAERIAQDLSTEDVIVFRYKLGNTPDSRLAERLGVSRPTAANMKAHLLERLRRDLQDLEPHMRSATMLRIAALTDLVTL